jgi:hypothetical protein
MNLADLIRLNTSAGATGLGILGTWGIVLFVVVAIWTLVWKALALWKSARKTHTIWFIILMIVNTLGILEILYIYIFSKLGEKPAQRSTKKRR